MMKFSEKWLREFVNPQIDTEKLTHQLTMAGLEVDAVSPACLLFDGLVVAEVRSVIKHPDADGLHICEVDCGEKAPLTIVCGAANVRAGLFTVLARVGAKLPGKPQLKAVELKGITSHGMLCSAREMGLGEEDEGIIELSKSEEIGKALNELIDPNDNIIEISLTPNRGDCLSIKGIAREVATMNLLEQAKSNMPDVAVSIKSSREIKTTESAACPRYLGRVLEEVDASKPSPLWLREKLRRSGLRSINVVVDIINFVMLETGQPMHAFDNDLLSGPIRIRNADKGERVKLLDGAEYALNADTLVIADDKGPVSMAGIMGGFDSAVSEKSTRLFLESAFFAPQTITGRGRQYGLHTDSSHRFERGVDPQLQREAIERASELILMLGGGQAGPIIECKNDEHIPVNQPVSLRRSQIKRVLGTEFDHAFVTNTFKKLGMQLKSDKNKWDITPPSHRFDISIEVDLIEELARIKGYDALPITKTTSILGIEAVNRQKENLKKIKDAFVNRDYQEVITYSFVDPHLLKRLNIKNNAMVLANPISPELSVMRPSLWPGLLNTLSYNLKRQKDRVRLFESGLVFQGNDELNQVLMIAGLIYGNKYKKQWDTNNSLCDFYDMKGDVSTVLTALLPEDKIDFRVSEHASLHPGRTVDIIIDGNTAGCMGQLHPQINPHLDLVNSVYLFEIKVKNILDKEKARYQAFSKFPTVRRDIAILIDDEIPYSALYESVKKSSGELLTNLELFDVYRGEDIEKGKKSLAFNLTFQATSITLKDEEIETIMENIIDGLNNNFGAKLRE